MASTKEIRSKIASVENTQKITSAMEMVATSKMRNAQDSMNNAKPYTKALRRVISHISKSQSQSTNSFVKKRKLKKCLFVVITTDRGLCGGLNINLLKQVLNSYSEFTSQNIEVELAVIGNKGIEFFHRLGIPVVYSLKNLGDKVSAETTLGFSQAIVDDYVKEVYDSVELFYSSFVNTMVQKPSRIQYLPLPHLPQEEDSANSGSWDYLYEGEQDKLLDDLINRYILSQLHTSLLESLACEQAARMIAMKAATDNASQIIDELRLVYNKVRQASITNELNEIVAGAAAV